MAFQKQLRKISKGKGFIAALDQSGGSTPKALASYGVSEGSYASEEEMFEAIHRMRTRIINSPAFNNNRVIGAILFEKTIDSSIEGEPTVSHLWNELNIVPFLKIDKGLAAEYNGVQMMKDIPKLDEILDRAVAAGVFGTKTRSVIHDANEKGIKDIVQQQFQIGSRIIGKGLVPIIEPEISINSPNKALCEELLRKELLKELNKLSDKEKVIFKVTLPEEPNFYKAVREHNNTAQIVALSGGYNIDEACARLSKNDEMIASFSRVLTSGLKVTQTEKEFNATLDEAVRKIYKASVGKNKASLMCCFGK